MFLFPLSIQSFDRWIELVRHYLVGLVALLAPQYS
jgi:hypothetical protein